MKTTALDWNDFMSGALTPKHPFEIDTMKIVKYTSRTLLIAHIVMTPGIAFAADSSFNNAMAGVMSIVDWLNKGVIIFSGTNWMFGNRTKAIELLTGGSIGYEIARHYNEIHSFLKSI